MPGGDRTGPMGMGPRTGRGAGYCAGQGLPVGMNRGFRGGRGAGGQGGRGHRHMFYATGLTGWQRAAANAPDLPPDATPSQEVPPEVPPEEELQALKAQADAAAATLERIRQRIDELAPKTSEL